MVANDANLLQNRITKNVLVLGKQTATALGIQSYLQNKGLKAILVESVNDLPLHMELHHPIFILASDQVPKSQSQMFFSYLKRKYKIPVIPFQDVKILRDPKTKTPLIPKEVASPTRNDDHEIQTIATSLFENITAQINDKTDKSKLNNESSSVPLISIAETTGVVADFIKSNTRRVLLNVPTDSELQILSLKFTAGKESGFFIFATPPDESNSQKTAFENFKSRIKQVIGEQVLLEESQQILPYDLYCEMKNNSEFSIEGILDNQEFMFSVFETQQYSELHETFIEHGSLFSIPIEEWWSKMPLPYNSFVWFEKNKKKLLYVRSGDTFRPETIERALESSNRPAVRAVCIEPNDFEKYLQLRELILASRIA